VEERIEHHRQSLPFEAQAVVQLSQEGRVGDGKAS